MILDYLVNQKIHYWACFNMVWTKGFVVMEISDLKPLLMGLFRGLNTLSVRDERKLLAF